MVRLKVEPPHESFTYAGYTVGREWTPVPEHAAAGILSATATAGVTITQES
jgi:hypothetical protein